MIFRGLSEREKQEKKEMKEENEQGRRWRRNERVIDWFWRRRNSWKPIFHMSGEKSSRYEYFVSIV